MNDLFPKFLEAMKREVPDDARVMLCQFPGDPNADVRGKWRAYVVNDPSIVHQRENVYLCVSAMRAAENPRTGRMEFRRRKANFAGGLLLMVDDLGDGPAAKFPMSAIAAAPPTALIETSPDNFQAIYLFERAVTDIETFDALIRAFIAKQFLGADTGMAGVNRVFRPPAGVNGKPKHMRDGKPWQVRLAEWHPDRRWTVEGLVEAFGLTLQRRGRRLARGATTDKAANIRAFVHVRRALQEAGMMKRDAPDVAGWTEMRCPWTDEHTGRVDNGAAIRLPADENRFMGAFRCHHGNCDGRGWRELTEWLADEAGVVLDAINRAAPPWSEVVAWRS